MYLGDGSKPFSKAAYRKVNMNFAFKEQLLMHRQDIISCACAAARHKPSGNLCFNDP